MNIKANNPKAIDPFFKMIPKINNAQPDKINSKNKMFILNGFVFKSKNAIKLLMASVRTKGCNVWETNMNRQCAKKGMQHLQWLTKWIVQRSIRKSFRHNFHRNSHRSIPYCHLLIFVSQTLHPLVRTDAIRSFMAFLLLKTNPFKINILFLLWSFFISRRVSSPAYGC